MVYRSRGTAGSSWRGDTGSFCRILSIKRAFNGSSNALQADVSYGVSARLSAFVSLPLFTSKRVVHAHVLGSHAPTEPTDPQVPTEDPHGHGRTLATLRVALED